MYKLALIYDTSYLLNNKTFTIHFHPEDEINVVNIVTDKVLMELESHLNGDKRDEAVKAQAKLVDCHGRYEEVSIGNVTPDSVPDVILGAVSKVDKSLIAYAVLLAALPDYDRVVIMTSNEGIKRTLLKMGNHRTLAARDVDDLELCDLNLRDRINARKRKKAERAGIHRDNEAERERVYWEEEEARERLRKRKHAILVASLISSLFLLVGLLISAKIYISDPHSPFNWTASLLYFPALSAVTAIIWVISYYSCRYRN